MSLVVCSVIVRVWKKEYVSRCVPKYAPHIRGNLPDFRIVEALASFTFSYDPCDQMTIDQHLTTLSNALVTTFPPHDYEGLVDFTATIPVRTFLRTNSFELRQFKAPSIGD